MQNAEIIGRALDKLRRLQASREATVEKAEKAKKRRHALLATKGDGDLSPEAVAELAALAGAGRTLATLDANIGELQRDLERVKALLDDL